MISDFLIGWLVYLREQTEGLIGYDDEKTKDCEYSACIIFVFGVSIVKPTKEIAREYIER